MLLSPHPSIKMLASVTDVEEALMALDAGVDIVDLKNPAAGALGALDYSIIEAIVKSIDARTTVSATIGDLPMDPALILAASKTMLATGVDVVKIGFFGNNFHQACLNALAPLAEGGAKLIGVMFADQCPDMQLLAPIAQAGFYGVMLDTAYKNGSHLLEHMNCQQLNAFVVKARAFGLEVGLAGSIQLSHIKELSSIEPSYLGFRGALCEHSNRTSRLDVVKMQAIKKMLE